MVERGEQATQDFVVEAEFRVDPREFFRVIERARVMGWSQATGGLQACAA